MTRSLQSLRAALLACAVLVPAAATARQPGPPESHSVGPPPAMMKALADHAAALTAMCPAAPTPHPGAPIHAVTWGDRGPPVLIIHGGVQGALAARPRPSGSWRRWAPWLFPCCLLNLSRLRGAWRPP